MILRKIKTLLLFLLGKKITSFIHGIRFYSLVVKKTKMDPEVTLLKRILEEGDVAVDVGANGADWTYRMSSIVGENGHIYAFEADTYYAQATKYALSLLKASNVTLFPVGLSDKQETLLLRVNEKDGSRHNGRAFIDKHADKNDSGVEVIQLETLDSFINRYPRLNSVKLIKCDVEGFELFVFRGAEEIIRKVKPIVILEIGHFERQGYDAKTLYSFFRQYGYQGFSLTTTNSLELTNEELNGTMDASVNRIMIPSNLIGKFTDIIL